MAEIGLRSGKLSAGRYRYGQYLVIKDKTGWWWVYFNDSYTNMNSKLARIKPCSTLNEAYTWCRKPVDLQDYRGEYDAQSKLG